MENRHDAKIKIEATAIAALSDELSQLPNGNFFDAFAAGKGIDEIELQDVEQALLNQLDQPIIATAGQGKDAAAAVETKIPATEDRQTAAILPAQRRPATATRNRNRNRNGGGNRKRPRANGSRRTYTRRRAVNFSRISSGYRRTKRIVKRSLAAKDLGRWKPADDLALITNVLQTSDLSAVYLGTTFSCKFTYHEVQARWCALLRDASISKVAIDAMRKLHPEMVHAVQCKALFSEQEEIMLGTFKSTDTPTLLQFEELLQNNGNVFYWSRTPKTLYKYWQQMKNYKLLPDQKVTPLHNHDEPLTFSEAEEIICDAELIAAPVNQTLEAELELADRLEKKQIRLLEAEMINWTKLVDLATEDESTPTFDGTTLAILRGRNVRYLMRSQEISFGRRAKDCFVDVDLSLEGAAYKISRRQGIIRMRTNGDFFIVNQGKRAIFVNGKPLLRGPKARLGHNFIIEICDLNLIFLINDELIKAIRQQSAKTISPLK